MTAALQMPSPKKTKKGGSPLPVLPDLNPTLSPADAIAEAWKKESQENQEKWRREDAKARYDYEARRRWKKDRPKM
ncbi:hypothetical protein PILCRDRAFT_823935 [Piloderma croceum F 1598]|jgi:hypothetical protein|uniref:Uncharacterized protein n=1 Tax=Piloderma croceum (strain F 1598) TaxID=765440 RepID=A0A0C3BNC8_PILCF|nr:hypothetical protein PILCRDRAFT_823935 [Piloderma croceum F 1598]